MLHSIVLYCNFVMNIRINEAEATLGATTREHLRYYSQTENESAIIREIRDDS